MPENTDELSWSALEKIHDYFADSAIAICNKGEEVAHQLMIVNCDDDGKVLQFAGTPGELMARFFQGGDGKDAFALFMKEILSEGSHLRNGISHALGFAPRALVLICEAWILETKSVEDMEKLQSGGHNISEDPRRKEVLQVAVHTRKMSVPTVHAIESVPTRHCVRGKFPPRESAMHFGGRFAMQDYPLEGTPRH